jgi:2-hydroxy-6-oxonona-2,4-dienedioate hydrolase
MAETVWLNGFPLRLELRGDGIPVVYTPGAFYALERARPVAERLANLGFKVLLWDRPNTGGSGLLFENEHLLRIWSRTLRDLLDHIGIQTPYLAGVANGLLFSLHFASLYPDRVKGLVLGAALTNDMEWWQSVFDASLLEPARVAEMHGMAAALELGQGVWGVFDWPEQFQVMPEKRQQLLAIDAVTVAEALRTWASSYANPGPARFGGLTIGQISQIGVPALVFSGPSAFYGPAEARVLAEALPRAELVVSSDYHGDRWDDLLREIDETGDFEHFAASFAERIDQFIRSVERQRKHHTSAAEHPTIR